MYIVCAVVLDICIYDRGMLRIRKIRTKLFLHGYGYPIVMKRNYKSTFKILCHPAFFVSHDWTTFPSSHKTHHSSPVHRLCLLSLVVVQSQDLDHSKADVVIMLTSKNITICQMLMLMLLLMMIIDLMLIYANSWQMLSQSFRSIF